MSKGRRSKHIPQKLHGRRQLPVQHATMLTQPLLRPYIFVWIQDVPYTLHELGDIAHMCMTDMMEALFERGYFGHYPEGHTWYDHVDRDCFKMIGYDSTNEISATHRKQFSEFERHCQELCRLNAFTEQHRQQLIQMMRHTRMIERLVS